VTFVLLGLQNLIKSRVFLQLQPARWLQAAQQRI
jgi:hypothetical protein